MRGEEVCVKQRGGVRRGDFNPFINPENSGGE